MEHKHLPIEIKATPEGVVEGYGAIFNNRDLGGDIVLPGAFAKSLAERPVVKMLWQHDSYDVIGVWDEVLEDAKGLRVKGRIATTTTRGRDVAELAKMGAVDGLSIGYRTIQARKSETMEAREIVEASLWEVSIVTFPMNEFSRIDAVKAADMSRREFEQRLMQDAGFSRSVARALMGGGFDAVKAMQDAGGDGLSELIAHMRDRIPS